MYQKLRQTPEKFTDLISMKKTIAFLAFLSLASCSHSVDSSPKANPNPQPPAGPQSPGNPNLLMQGTVVKLMLQLMMPQQAQAMAMPIPPSVMFQGNVGDLPEDMNGQTCQASRCAFLVDTGVRDGSSQMEQEDPKVIAAGAVVSGKFKLEASKDSTAGKARSDQPLTSEGEQNPSYQGRIFKIVVRNWDPATQTPLAPSLDDREYVVSSTDIRTKSLTAIQITPESTLSAQHRTEVLKSSPNSNEDGSFIQNLVLLFSSGMETVREASLRLLASLFSQDSTSAQIKATIVQNQVLFSETVLTKKAVDAPMSGLTRDEVLARLDEITLKEIEGIKVRQELYANQNIQVKVNNANDFYQLVGDYKLSQSQQAAINDPESEEYQEKAEVTASLANRIQAAAPVIAESCPQISTYISITNAISRIDVSKASAFTSQYSSDAEVQAKITPTPPIEGLAPEIASTSGDLNQATANKACCQATAEDSLNAESCGIPASVEEQN